MTLRIDPEENEIRALERAADWSGKRVLEIGCGTGRLTQRLAGLGAIVDASDTNRDAIKDARENLPHGFKGRVRFKVGSGERLGYRDGSFDAVVFAWSL